MLEIITLGTDPRSKFINPRYIISIVEIDNGSMIKFQEGAQTDGFRDKRSPAEINEAIKKLK